jgi:hypothetical protein
MARRPYIPPEQRRPVGRPVGSLGGGRPKGSIGHPRPRGTERAVVIYNLRQEMKAICPEAVKVVKRCLASKDERIALEAARIAFERGFGRVEISVEADVVHRFAIVPAVEDRETWLRGAAEAAAEQAAKRAGESLKGVARHSGEGEVLDLTAEPDPRLDPDPTGPAPDGTKLN